MRPIILTIPAAAALLAGAAAFAQQAEFDAPERITAAGDNFSKILYPSPVLFDLDGDQKRDLVIGDLFGHIKAAAPDDSGNDLTWSALTPIQADGKPLKLNNW